MEWMDKFVGTDIERFIFPVEVFGPWEANSISLDSAPVWLGTRFTVSYYNSGAEFFGGVYASSIFQVRHGGLQPICYSSRVACQLGWKDKDYVLP